MSITPGDICTLVPHGLSHDGRAVARTPDGLTIFVEGALPGQTIETRILKRKKFFAEAECVAILHHAPNERETPCPHAHNCGGCTWQAMPYVDQLHWKQQLLEDALLRIGKLREIPWASALLSMGEAGQWGYRNKMEFAFAPDNQGRTRLGLRQRASHAIVEVTGCLLQQSRTMQVVEWVRQATQSAHLHAWSTKPTSSDAYLRFLVIREPQARENESSQCLVELITSPVRQGSQAAARIEQLGTALMTTNLGVTGFIHSQRTAPTAVAYGEKVLFSAGTSTLWETLKLEGHAHPVRFALNHASFFQVNTQGAQLLYNEAARMAATALSSPPKQKSCWDIYCGVGGLSLALAPLFHQIRGLETVQDAVDLAAANAAPYGNCQFMQGDAALLETWFQRYGIPDMICLDPPRAGLAPEVLAALLAHQPASLLMVSCNPATLARDLKTLTPCYNLQEITAVDMFPQTPHVEAVALLQRLA